MVNSLLPTLRVKRLCMSHKEFNPRLAKNHLAGLSLVHREVVLNDLLMTLPSQETQMGGAQNALVVGLFAPRAPIAVRKDDESTRSPEGRVNSPMTVRVRKSVKEIVLALAIKGISRLFPHTDVKPAMQEQDLISHA
ncbi:hypothetical protein TB2_027732 [Malus domestica]